MCCGPSGTEELGCDGIGLLPTVGVAASRRRRRRNLFDTNKEYHGNSTQIVQSQVARKPEGQQCWPPIEHTNC